MIGTKISLVSRTENIFFITTNVFFFSKIDGELEVREYPKKFLIIYLKIFWRNIWKSKIKVKNLLLCVRPYLIFILPLFWLCISNLAYFFLNDPVWKGWVINPSPGANESARVRITHLTITLWGPTSEWIKSNQNKKSKNQKIKNCTDSLC